jgi:hypothetical protein
MPLPALADKTPRCTATAKHSGKPCSQPAMRGTTVCRYHGGAAAAGNRERQLRHGRYAKVLPEALRDAYEQHRADPDIGQVDDEIAAARALFGQFASQLRHKSSLQADEVAALFQALDRITGFAVRKASIESKHTVTPTQIAQWVGQVAQMVQGAIVTHVSDPAERDALILAIRQGVVALNGRESSGEASSPSGPPPGR